MPDWEKRIHILCAIEEDEREKTKMWSGLRFIAKLMVGEGDEPTPEKPVAESVTMSNGRQTTTKKVVDFDHEKKMEKLVEQSKDIMAKAGPILEKMRKEMAQKAAEGKPNG